MNIEQFKQAEILAHRIADMRFFGSCMEECDIEMIVLHNERGAVATITFSTVDGGRFVIEKMLEAGIAAARAVRAIAENDLEKL